VHRLCEETVRLCASVSGWTLLSEYVTILSKRRGQFPQALAKMIRACIGLLEGMSEDTRLSLIDTLREVTEGKMFVEVERARLTKMVAVSKEAKGDVKVSVLLCVCSNVYIHMCACVCSLSLSLSLSVSVSLTCVVYPHTHYYHTHHTNNNNKKGAAEVMQEIAVETLGGMERREKLEIILEQMRLSLAVSDYHRCVVISRKVSTKVLSLPDLEDQKLRFHRLMDAYNAHENDYLAISTSALAQLDTEQVKKDRPHAEKLLKAAVVYACLAQHGSEQQVSSFCSCDSNSYHNSYHISHICSSRNCCWCCCWCCWCWSTLAHACITITSVCYSHKTTTNIHTYIHTYMYIHTSTGATACTCE
jgi:26S proteasome regulatory subunit N5